MELLNINKYLEKSNYKDILDLLDNKEKFYNFIEIVNINFDTFNLLKIELIIKLILSKVTKFDGNVDNNSFQTFYEKLEVKNDINFDLLNSFIEKFDKYKEIKLNFISLNFQFVKMFKHEFKNLEKYSNNDNISKDDINNIKSIIDDEVLIYYNAFFEVNYNKFFFKRIIDAKMDVTKNINTIEMISRLKSLYKLFSKKMLETLQVGIISIDDFWNMDYLKRVNYYRQFHIKTNSLFKMYFTYYNQLNDLFYEISNIIHIDPLNYIDIINDSTSSFGMSDDDLEIDMTNFEDSAYFKQNVANLTINFESVDYDQNTEYNNDEDAADTPIPINICNEKLDNENINKNNDNDLSDEENENNDNNLSDEENEINIDDIFIKS